MNVFFLFFRVCGWGLPRSPAAEARGGAKHSNHSAEGVHQDIHSHCRYFDVKKTYAILNNTVIGACTDTLRLTDHMSIDSGVFSLSPK